MAEVFFSPCPRGLENLLVDELGALGARGAQAGEVACQFGSLDEFNGLIERLRASGG